VVDRVALEQTGATPVDTVRPQVTLVAPTTSAPASRLDLQVDATDDVGLARIVANIYRDGVLVQSTQSLAGGEKSATHTAALSLPDGAYSIKYNAQDLAGNISATQTFGVTIDATAPQVMVKEGSQFTTVKDGAYTKLGLKLYDAGKIDRVEINGTTKDLTDNVWSDVNGIRPGTFGAVSGANTLVAYDVAGNATTIEFTLR
jgi:hypothetical protein